MTGLIDIRREALPPVARELIEAVGFAAMLEIVERAGGCRLYVPKEARQDTQLARYVGRELAARLVEHFAGDELVVPTLHRHITRAERGRVLTSLGEGAMTVNDAARALGITSRHVYRLKGRAADPHQGCLAFASPRRASS